MGLGTDADLDPGKVLAADTGNDGFYAVVPTGATIGPDTEPAGCQRNIVIHYDDIRGGDVEESGKLLDGLTLQIHKGLGLEQEDLAVFVGNLVV